MSANTHTLSINGGAAATLTSLGCRNVVLEKATLDVGSLRFAVPVAAMTDSIPYTYGDTLTLYRDATIIFIGRVRQIAWHVGAKDTFYTIAAFDVWWEMERTIYRQPTTAYNVYGTLTGYLSTRVVLNQDAWGRALAQGQQIQNAMIYFNYLNQNLINTSPAPADGQTVPVEETREVTIAEVVRRAASLTPSLFPYVGYSTGLWVQGYAARGALTLSVLDLNPAFTIITNISGLRPLTDAVPVGVVFDFISTVQTVDGPRAQLSRQVAGTPGAANTIYATFNLPDCSSAPSLAAAAYYASLLQAQWVGSITTKEEECTGSVNVGDGLRLANGRTEWATMDAYVRRTVEDLDTGETTIELGPPDAMQIDDFISMMLRFRNRPIPNGFCAVQHNGTEGTPTGIDDYSQPTVPPDGTGGSQDGVTGSATDNAPGVPSPVANESAGLPSGGGITAGHIEFLALCDGTNIAVLSP